MSSGSTPAHVFVESVEAPDLDPEDAHHLSRVLRLRTGEAVTVADGRGGWRACRFEGGDRLEPVGEVEHRTRPAPAIAVGFGLSKGDKPEWTVQKLTELGVDHILLLACERSVVRWDAEKAEHQRHRLVRVARGAAMQSRQAWLPELSGPVSPAQALVGLGPAALAHPGGEPPALARPSLLVGPEGGWSQAELDCAPATVGLGPSILRAETAAVAAGLLLGALRAGVVVGFGHGE